jgi:hypothetical protein
MYNIMTVENFEIMHNRFDVVGMCTGGGEIMHKN